MTKLFVLAAVVSGCDRTAVDPAKSDNSESLPASEQLASTGHDWPQWRGPAHDGVSRETDWNSDWKTHPPTFVWKANVGVGFSSLSVADGRLYTMGNRRSGADQPLHDVVTCLNAATGDAVWEFVYPCEFSDQYHEGGPGATPTVAANRVYTLSRCGHLHCLAAESGDVLWMQNLADDLGVEIGEWGFTCSPLILEDKLIVEAGRTAAYDSQSGKRLWQTREYRNGYGSPVPLVVEGDTHIAVFNNDALVVINADNGNVADEYPWETSYVATSTTPVVSGNRIFISSGYNTGCALLKFEAGKLHEIYTSRLMRNHFSNSVLYRGTVYGMDGNSHSARNVELVAYDLDSGRVRWSQRGFGCGSVAVSGGKLLILSENGQLIVAAATPEEYRELSRQKVLDGRCWTAPVLSHAHIYCRNANGDVVCLDVDR